MKTSTLASVTALLWTTVACSGGTSPVAPTAGVPAPGSSFAASPAAPVHSVNGTGVYHQLPQVPEAAVRHTISARLDATGDVHGTATAHIIDLSVFGIEGKPSFVNEVDCLEFDGNTVWFGTHIVESSRPEFPVGTRGIGIVQDRPEGDLTFSGPADFFAPGQTCHDRPALPLLPVEQGQFVVR